MPTQESTHSIRSPMRLRSVQPALRCTRAVARIENLEQRLLLSAWYVSNSGSDAASGLIASPWQTVQYALDHAVSGDTINLRAGVYAGDLWINTPNLTLTSYTGENASITSPIDNPTIQVTVRIGAEASGTQLLNLDISGGYNYAIKTESTWDTGDPNPHAASQLLLQNLRVHDSGNDLIKFTPGTSNSLISGSELFNSGRRDPGNAEGIDAVNANYMTVRDTSIHDTTTNGMYFKGGSVSTLIERNRVYNTGHSGILLGQSTDNEWFSTSTNPNYYENIDGIVRNNLVWHTQGAGIGAWGALRPQIYNNTLYGVARTMFGGLLIQGQEHWIPLETMTPSKDVTMYNNIVVVTGTRAALEIRENGLVGTLTLGNNLYYLATGPVQISDLTRGFYGSLAVWQSLGQDAGSLEANPLLGAAPSLELSPTSPAIDRGRATSLTTDLYNRPRPVGAAVDIGAEEYQTGGPVVNQLAAPTNLVITVQGPSQAALAWTNNSPSATGLLLERATDPGFRYDLISTPLAPATTGHPSYGMMSNITYYFRLRASDGTSVSSWATANVKTMLIPPVPNVPGTPVIQSVSSSQISLQWSASPPNFYSGSMVPAYLVERSTTSDFASLTRFAVGEGILSFNDTAIAPGALYFYRVCATNISGWSDPSGIAYSATQGAPPPNRAPTDILLSADNLAENRPAGTAIGTLSAIDPDLIDSWTFSLPPGEADNAMFQIDGNQLKSAASFDYELKNSYSIRIRTTDSQGLIFEKLFTISISNVDELPPTGSITVNAGAAQRSMVKSLTATFNEAVTLSAGAILLQKHGGGAVANVAMQVSNPSGDGRTYAITFTGRAVVGGSLPDGIYDLVIKGNLVHDMAGNAMASDTLRAFHRLYGDYEGNKTVNSSDYFQFKKTIGKSTANAGFMALFDYNGDGTVNNTDYFQFKKRMGVSYSYT